MRFEDAISIAYENYSNYLDDGMWVDDTPHVCCAVCPTHLREDDDDWIMPHPCGKAMKDEEAFVCSKECAKEWREDKWEWIEEYEEKQGEI